ncbi:helix-turn-helix domain-containing protein [Mycolicibacterium hodleri]|uniref:helix-turn-helix domain-containing protein n=1 Tax=Mycolicibacterium hodleri TaxID=49897 RepID=UPI000AA1C81B|nr:helix-turn-helix domain-containing protein [Mycolicibacterium hodleri]
MARPKGDPSPPDMTMQDTADYMKVSINTVRARIADGTLPAVRIGRSRLVRLRRSDIDEALMHMSD